MTAAGGGDGAERATHGGAGWRDRGGTLDAEVAAGTVWRRCGCRSEVAPLRAVLLHWPGDELLLTGSPDEQLMLEVPDLAALRREAEAIAACYRGHGVTVERHDLGRLPPPNFIFQRDLFFMTPAGAVVGRPAAAQRAGEERFAAQTLAALGVPLLMTPVGDATFEGADALWLDDRTLLVGVGRRTNRAAREQLAPLMAHFGVRLVDVPMPTGVQHLLGIVNFIDHDLAALHAAKAPPELRQVLGDHGVRALELSPDDELLRGRGMNFVTLAPRVLVMPAGCPGLARTYRAAGVEVHEVEVTEYLKAAGGPGCLTGILWRE